MAAQLFIQAAIHLVDLELAGHPIAENLPLQYKAVALERLLGTDGPLQHIAPQTDPIQLSEEYLERLRTQQPELADAKRARYQADYGLPPYDCHMITSDKALARFFEALVELGTPPKQGANWIMGQVLGALSARGLEPQEMKLTAPTLARLIALVGEGRLNRNTAVKVFEAVFDDDSDVEQYVKAHGLEQIGDEGLVAEVVARVLAANPQSAADYKGGREKAFGFLVGQVMRELKGKADPRVVNALLRRKLAE